MVDHGAEHSFGCNLVTHEDDGWRKVIRSGARDTPRRPLPTIGDVLMAKGFTKGFKVLMDEDSSESIESQHNTLFAMGLAREPGHCCCCWGLAREPGQSCSYVDNNHNRLPFCFQRPTTL